MIRTAPDRRVRWARITGIVVAVALAATVVPATSPGAAAEAKRRKATTTTRPEGAAARCAGAKASNAATATPRGPSAETVVAQDGSGSEPRVELVRYPRPSGDGNPWSQWGQGLVLPDGTFLSAIGNHLGEDGNSYLFSYDPSAHTITRFADIRSQLGDELDWGYGKIHGQIVAGRCGEAYFATYWGTRTGLRYTPRYAGDEVFRVDTRTLALTPLGALVPERGIPSLAASPDGTTIYGEAVDPTNAGPPERGTFFVLDAKTGDVVFREDADALAGFRNVLVAEGGHAYVAARGGRLLEYVPGATSLRPYAQVPGGGKLRASTAPTRDGTVYFATQRPDRFFAFRSDGTIEPIADAAGYTTSMAAEPDGSAFYSVPAAHGDRPELGAPVVAVDPETGTPRTIVRLADLVRRELGLETAGSYDVALDADRRRLYVGLNVGPTKDDPWGEVVLAVVELR